AIVGSGTPATAESSGAELSVVGSPLSVAREVAQDIAEARNMGRAADPARATADGGAPAEANTAADELSNNGQRTTGHGQCGPAQKQKRPTEATMNSAVVRWRLSVDPEGAEGVAEWCKRARADNAARPANAGALAEANTAADELSNNGLRTTDNG